MLKSIVVVPDSGKQREKPVYRAVQRKKMATPIKLRRRRRDETPKAGKTRAIAGPDPDRIQLLGFLVATIMP